MELRRDKPNLFLSKSRKGREKVLEYDTLSARHGLLYAMLYPDGSYVLRSEKKHGNGKPIIDKAGPTLLQRALKTTSKTATEEPRKTKRKYTRKKSRPRSPRIPADFTTEALARFEELLNVYGNLNSPTPMHNPGSEDKKWRIARYNRVTRENEHIGILHVDGRFSRDLLNRERMAGLNGKQKDTIIRLESLYGRLGIYKLSNGSCQLRMAHKAMGRITLGTVHTDGEFVFNKKLPQEFRHDEPTRELDLTSLRRNSA